MYYHTSHRGYLAKLRKTDYVVGSKNQWMSLGDIEIRCTKQARTRILDIDEDDANDRIHVTKHSGGPEAAGTDRIDR